MIWYNCDIYKSKETFFSNCVLLENLVLIDPIINCFTCLKNKAKEDKISTVKIKTVSSSKNREIYLLGF